MISFGFAAIPSLFLLSIILFYILTRLELINKALYGRANLKAITKRLNLGGYFFFALEIVMSVVSIFPPIKSFCLFALSSIGTFYDLFLIIKGKFVIRFPDLAKRTNSVLMRFYIKMLSYFSSLIYLIVILIQNGNAINNERYGKYKHV